VPIVATQVQWRGQLSLIEHDYVGFLLRYQPVQVLLLFRRIQASDIPHQHRYRHFAHTQVRLPSTSASMRIWRVTCVYRRISFLRD